MDAADAERPEGVAGTSPPSGTKGAKSEKWDVVAVIVFAVVSTALVSTSYAFVEVFQEARTRLDSLAPAGSKVGS